VFVKTLHEPRPWGRGVHEDPPRASTLRSGCSRRPSTGLDPDVRVFGKTLHGPRPWGRGVREEPTRTSTPTSGCSGTPWTTFGRWPLACIV